MTSESLFAYAKDWRMAVLEYTRSPVDSTIKMDMKNVRKPWPAVILSNSVGWLRPGVGQTTFNGQTLDGISWLSYPSRGLSHLRWVVPVGPGHPKVEPKSRPCSREWLQEDLSENQNENE